MKKVMVMGTFDLLHKGHLYLLQQAKKQGDYLVVLIARDKTVETLKGRKPNRNERQRLKDVKNSGIADKVILGNLKDKYSALIKEKPDIVCLGYDQKAFTDSLEEKLQKRGVNPKIIRLKPFKPQIYKTSKIAKKYLYSSGKK